MAETTPKSVAEILVPWWQPVWCYSVSSKPFLLAFHIPQNYFGFTSACLTRDGEPYAKLITFTPLFKSQQEEKTADCCTRLMCLFSLISCQIAPSDAVAKFNYCLSTFTVYLLSATSTQFYLVESLFYSSFEVEHLVYRCNRRPSHKIFHYAITKSLRLRNL